MARKIYMKFSDERNLENSIRTIICEDKDRRFVIKKPVFEEGVAHIRDMYEKASLLKQAFSNIRLNNAGINGDILQCDYVEGTNLTELYMNCISDRNREELMQVIAKHVELIKGNEDNQCVFCESDESKRLFGDLSRFNNKKALKITNFEATANNIYLSEQDIYFIDYEWIFDFPIPLDLVIYHCIVWTGYANMPRLADVISKEELMGHLQLDNELCDNHFNFINFINFVKGNNAYYLAKSDYAKGKYSIYDIDQIWLAKMAQQQKYIDNLEDGMKKQQEYICNLEGDKEKQQLYINNLETGSKSQRQYINDLEEAKDNLQEYIDGLNEEAEKKQEQIQNLSEISDEQKERIAYLEGALEVQNKYAANLESKIERYINKQYKK